MNKKDMAINLIIKCEGVKLSAYKDSGGIATIGIGTVKYPNNSPVKMGDKCTIDQAKKYLTDHLNKYVFPAVDKLTADADVPDTVYAALCSLGYNCGSALYSKSISQEVKNKNWQELAKVFKQYINVNKKPCEGLVNRRDIEIKYFMEA